MLETSRLLVLASAATRVNRDMPALVTRCHLPRWFRADSRNTTRAPVCFASTR